MKQEEIDAARKAGHQIVYVPKKYLKADGFWYIRTSDGVEYRLEGAKGMTIRGVIPRLRMSKKERRKFRERAFREELADAEKD